jgi:ABC-type sulfate/molybdate transport systems ATPase subunit
MELQDVILGILEGGHLTALLITHDVDEAVYMSDRVVMMTNGPGAKVGEILEIDFPHPRDRSMIMADANFFRYRERLLRFLDECGHARAHPAPIASTPPDAAETPAPEARPPATFRVKLDADQAPQTTRLDVRGGSERLRTQPTRS